MSNFQILTKISLTKIKTISERLNKSLNGELKTLSPVRHLITDNKHKALIEISLNGFDIIMHEKSDEFISKLFRVINISFKKNGVAIHIDRGDFLKDSISKLDLKCDIRYI